MVIIFHSDFLFDLSWWACFTRIWSHSWKCKSTVSVFRFSHLLNLSPLIIMLYYIAAIYVIALGTGGIKPNVCTMGADQFDDRYSRDRKEKESFFNWYFKLFTFEQLLWIILRFYWSINLGALISFTVVAYICQEGIPALGIVKLET